MITLVKIALIFGVLFLFWSEPSNLSYYKVKTVSATQCLTANIFFEARGESTKGMRAVAEVTYNRVLHKRYPKDVCSVVFQRKQFSWTHQQDYSTILNVLDGDLKQFAKKDHESYKKALDIATEFEVDYKPELLPKEAIFYHSVKVNPKWANLKIRVKKISRHIFYRNLHA